MDATARPACELQTITGRSGYRGPPVGHRSKHLEVRADRSATYRRNRRASCSARPAWQAGRWQHAAVPARRMAARDVWDAADAASTSGGASHGNLIPCEGEPLLRTVPGPRIGVKARGDHRALWAPCPDREAGIGVVLDAIHEALDSIRGQVTEGGEEGHSHTFPASPVSRAISQRERGVRRETLARAAISRRNAKRPARGDNRRLRHRPAANARGRLAGAR